MLPASMFTVGRINMHHEVDIANDKSKGTTKRETLCEFSRIVQPTLLFFTILRTLLPAHSPRTLSATHTQELTDSQVMVAKLLRPQDSDVDATDGADERGSEAKTLSPPAAERSCSISVTRSNKSV